MVKGEARHLSNPLWNVENALFNWINRQSNTEFDSM